MNTQQFPLEHQSNTPWFYKAIEQAWYDPKAPWAYRWLKYALLPLVPIFCLLARFRRWQQESRCPKSIGVPIIVVGNITVGGTGKTPLVIYISQLLKSAGYKPGIISRGYGGEADTWPQRVTAASLPHQVGDEPVLMASKTNVPVVVGADRNTDIQCLLNTYDCDVIISDDGLQHYKMPRDIEIIVIDGVRRLGNGLCLPAGPLRESKQRLTDCDLLVTNGGTALANEFGMCVTGDHLVSLNHSDRLELSKLKGNTVHAVTGIGNPERFFKHLEQAGVSIIKHSFVDHHVFQMHQLLFNDGLPVIMTEKDAIKCKGFSVQNCWYLPIEAQLNDTFKQALLHQISQS